jgi:pimeloyl-ACP methyl ester carboxylesterase
VGSPVLLLHGLAGHAEEWAETASWLTARCRVIALDARGHGHSDRFPGDVSSDALVADAAFMVEALGLPPVIVVGQSFGGLTAVSLAARRPDLVRGLVIVEASPAGEDDDVEEAAHDLGTALREWPVPFPSRREAEAFFAARFGGRLAAEAWASGLEQREDGWWPRFDVRVIIQMLRQASPNWDEWERIRCPTMVVRAGRGFVDPAVAEAMIARLPTAKLTELPDAAHDLHLDRPGEWQQTLNAFFDSLDQSRS